MSKEIVKGLPNWQEPTSLSDAKILIQNLGRNMGEHAYIIGRILIWVKSRLKHGKFIDWIEENVWFTPRTAQNFIGFATQCLEAKKLLEQPHYLERAKSENISHLESSPLPPGKYSTIYADPPWPVDSMILDKWKSPLDDKYQTMTIEEIRALDVPSLAHDDCSLFLWTTHTYLREVFDVIEAWGFKYHCCITWDKGAGWSLCGFHRRTEFCLYAYKGKINISQTGEFIPTLIEEKKRQHSEKPEIMYQLIESHSPEPRIELFARNIRNGWDSWGNQI